MAKFEPGHKKVGGRTEGKNNKFSDLVDRALNPLSETLSEDIAQMSPSERVHAFIRLLSVVIPKNFNIDLHSQEADTLAEILASMCQAQEQKG